MTGKEADSVRRGLEEALAYAEGTADMGRHGVHVPADIDVKAVRTKLDMTQEEFAGRFGFSINTLRHWEQGRRVPEWSNPRLSLGHQAQSEGRPKGVEGGMRGHPTERAP
jgi:putative transcriptional regulator